MVLLFIAKCLLPRLFVSLPIFIGTVFSVLIHVLETFMNTNFDSSYKTKNMLFLLDYSQINHEFD